MVVDQYIALSPFTCQNKIKKLEGNQNNNSPDSWKNSIWKDKIKERKKKKSKRESERDSRRHTNRGEVKIKEKERRG